MQGRKPTPTGILKLRGSWRADARDGEPEFGELDDLDPPAWLDEVAAAEWSRLAVTLAETGVLTVADRAMFAAYCIAYARWVKADLCLTTSGGDVITGANGHPVVNPWSRVARQALVELRACAVQFGLTPSARRGLSVEKPKPQGVRSRARFFEKGGDA